ncbi:MAG: hypothetical protein JXP34_20520 [Planctomycetes bacterium]|nr:hypothetical protein [Planctomycetota bacterium]
MLARVVHTALCWTLFLGIRAAPASDWFVGPEGETTGTGSREAPWDLASALAGRKEIAPGDSVRVRGGTYRGKFQVKLAGTEKAPIVVRAVPGERATILDSGVLVVEPADYVWLWDLEIAGSVPVEKRETQRTGSSPGDLPGADGLNIRAGKGCKFIHLLIHDNVQGGMSWWINSTDGEIHGCIVYGNGWRAPDRGHGHCLYTQNKDGVKTISACIFSVPYDGQYTMHAYGSSRASIDNFLIEDNIAYERGPFLVGGGSPSHGIRVLRNSLHGIDMRIGYGAQNEDCELRDNIVARGRISIDKFKKVVDEGNVRELPARKAILIPSRYDPARAHIAVYNGAKAASVDLDVSKFLKEGERFRLLSPRDLWGKAIAEGTCSVPTIAIPMAAEFAAFVLLKERKP